MYPTIAQFKDYIENVLQVPFDYNKLHKRNKALSFEYSIDDDYMVVFHYDPFQRKIVSGFRGHISNCRTPMDCDIYYCDD